MRDRSPGLPTPRMGVMANPFYQDLGSTKEEVAAVTKVFGVIMTLVGAFVGGVVTAKIGVMKTLFLGGFLSAGTNLLFSALASVGHDLTFLIFTVSADNLAGGLASAAFVAYLSGLTNSAYSATQYALFSSVMLLPKFLAGFSGLPSGHSTSHPTPSWLPALRTRQTGACPRRTPAPCRGFAPEARPFLGNHFRFHQSNPVATKVKRTSSRMDSSQQSPKNTSASGLTQSEREAMTRRTSDAFMS